MDNPGYIGATRMNGLQDELRLVANNIANVSTDGYRATNLVFAEVLAEAEVQGGALAMAAPRAHYTDANPGGLRATGGALDLAIQGDAWFQIETPQGPRLTRAGAYRIDAQGTVVNAQGHALLNEGGGRINVPQGARDIVIGDDGAISVDGQPLARVGLFTAEPIQMLREDGVRFRVDGPIQPAQDATMRQGFVEGSNVSAVREMARLVEIQRAYEQNQSFLDAEDQRQREAVRTLGRTA
jgi:flagellar basal-body rod protein FlgF